MLIGGFRRGMRRRDTMRFGFIGIFGLASVVTAGRQAAGQAMGYLDLVITYAGSTMLSPEARLTVEVYDESVPGGRSTPLIRRAFVLQDTIPVTVQVPYFLRDVDPSRRYTLGAHIEDRGRRHFQTRQPVPVLTMDAGTVLTVILDAVQ